MANGKCNVLLGRRCFAGFGLLISISSAWRWAQLHNHVLPPVIGPVTLLTQTTSRAGDEEFTKTDKEASEYIITLDVMPMIAGSHRLSISEQPPMAASMQQPCKTTSTAVGGEELLTVDEEAEDVSSRGIAATPVCQPRESKRRITYHIPMSSYDCRFDHKGKNNTCGKLKPIPTKLLTNIQYCGEKGGYKSHYNYYVHAMLLQEELARRTGIQLEPVADAFTADVVFCSSWSIMRFLNETQERKLDRQPLVVVVDSFDSGTVTTPPKILSSSCIVAVLKPYSMVGLGGVCPGSEPDGPKARHMKLLEDFNSMPPNPCPLSAARLNAQLKEAGCLSTPEEGRRKHFIAIPQPITVRGSMSSQSSLRPLSARPWDIAFTGKTSYGGTNLHGKFRLRMIQRLQAAASKHKWRAKFATTRLSRSQYYDILRSTKLFISPWGNGEWSMKDEEAILRGAVLVKPGASLLESSIPMYIPNVTCLDVRADGMDIVEVIVEALANPALLEKIQGAAFQALSGFITYGRAVQQEDMLRTYTTLVQRLGDAAR